MAEHRQSTFKGLAMVSCCGVFWAAGACAAEQGQEYKCHVLDENDRAHLYWVVVVPSQRQRVFQALPGEWLQDPYGQPLAKIAKVQECRPIAQPCQAPQAQQLEAQSPR